MEYGPYVLLDCDVVGREEPAVQTEFRITFLELNMNYRLVQTGNHRFSVVMVTVDDGVVVDAACWVKWNL